MAKEKEERKIPPKETEEQDEIPLFYSDLMPLLVRKVSVIFKYFDASILPTALESLLKAEELSSIT